ncbi:MAG: hypothetical protein ACLUN5_14060 [Oscillospiraceae bacterium]
MNGRRGPDHPRPFPRPAKDEEAVQAVLTGMMLTLCCLRDDVS